MISAPYEVDQPVTEVVKRVPVTHRKPHVEQARKDDGEDAGYDERNAEQPGEAAFPCTVEIHDEKNGSSQIKSRFFPQCRVDQRETENDCEPQATAAALRCSRRVRACLCGRARGRMSAVGPPLTKRGHHHQCENDSWPSRSAKAVEFNLAIKVETEIEAKCGQDEPKDQLEGLAIQYPAQWESPYHRSVGIDHSRPPWSDPL